MQPSRWKRALLILGIGILAIAGLGAWAFASPAGSSPDDDYHLASIWCAQGERDSICELTEHETARALPESIVYSSHCYALKSEQSAACAPKGDEMMPTGRGSFQGEQSATFYSAMSIFVGSDEDASVILMRLVNVTLFVSAVIATVVFLRPGQRGPVIWAATVGLVPAGVFFIASTNPSSWAVLSGLIVWMAIVGYFKAERRRNRIVLGIIAAVVGIMGAGARSDAAVYVAIAALVAVVLTYSSTKNWRLLALLPLGLMLVGAYFFLFSSQSSWAVAPAITEVGQNSDGESGFLGLAAINLMLLPTLLLGNSGSWGLGWQDTPMIPTVPIIAAGILLVIVFWGLRKLTRRKGIALGFTLFVLIAFPLYVLHGQQVRVGSEVQPRYMLPLLLVFIGVALYDLNREDLGLNKLQGFIVFFGIAATNSLALYSTMKRYISGSESLGASLNTTEGWWWSMSVQPMTVWFLGSAAFALLMLGLYLLLFTRGGQRLMPNAEDASEPPVRASAEVAGQSGR